jgi:AraC-like DNA-binding protein
MLGQVPELSTAQGDGALPATLSSGSPGGQSMLAEIAASTGFADQSHLSRWVRRVHGVSPSQLAA